MRWLLTPPVQQLLKRGCLPCRCHHHTLIACLPPPLHPSSLQLQLAWRGYMEWKQQEALRREAAAIKLQSAWRMRVAYTAFKSYQL
jgi:hypothetical protein